MLYEYRRPEQELAAADRNAENDDAGTDDTEPAEALRRRRRREFGDLQGSSSFFLVASMARSGDYALRCAWATFAVPRVALGYPTRGSSHA